MSKTGENPTGEIDSEWSLKNTLRRILMYLLCLFFFAIGFLLLDEGGWQGCIITIPIWLLCVSYIVYDVRLLRMARRAKTRSESGTPEGLREVRIENDELICEFPDEPVTRINLREVKLIGEYREEGGFIGKWFLVLFKSEDDGMVVSLLHDDSQNVVYDLAKYFNSTMQLKLRSAARWKSRVIWPLQVVDSPIWENAGSKGIRTALEKFEKRKPTELKLTSQVMSVLNSD